MSDGTRTPTHVHVRVRCQITLFPERGGCVHGACTSGWLAPAAAAAAAALYCKAAVTGIAIEPRATSERACMQTLSTVQLNIYQHACTWVHGCVPSVCMQLHLCCIFSDINTTVTYGALWTGCVGMYTHTHACTHKRVHTGPLWPPWPLILPPPSPPSCQTQSYIQSPLPRRSLQGLRREPVGFRLVHSGAQSPTRSDWLPYRARSAHCAQTSAQSSLNLISVLNAVKKKRKKNILFFFKKGFGWVTICAGNFFFPFYT